LFYANEKTFEKLACGRPGHDQVLPTNSFRKQTKQIDRQIDKKKDRQTKTCREKKTNRQKDRHGQKDEENCLVEGIKRTQKDRQTKRSTKRQTEKNTDRNKS
jgi:hypothetical protein